ncbi:HEAT repeat domain-containing protein [Candidatus Dependentiae bacterium]|nr:HEAT repeat domain-containing protein [Candidatus Dependentiae bacterium]
MRKKLFIILVCILSSSILVIYSLLAQNKKDTLNGRTDKKIKSLLQKIYVKDKEDIERYKLIKELSELTVNDASDLAEMRENIFLKRGEKCDVDLLEAAIKSISTISDSECDKVLIELLENEIENIKQGDNVNNKYFWTVENKKRYRCLIIIMDKLGKFKSKKAIPILKEYLNVESLKRNASDALIEIDEIGQKTELKNRAYKGENINYGGLGIEETKSLVDKIKHHKNKKEYKNLSKQLHNIKNPKAKQYIKELLNHDDEKIRESAAMAFIRITDAITKEDIVELTNNNDKYVRIQAITAIKKLCENYKAKHIKMNYTFTDELVKLLNDKESIVRLTSAHAMGFLKFKEFIPFLEKALSDKSILVREEAYYSLSVLSDIEYDFNGKEERHKQNAKTYKIQGHLWFD